MARYNTKISTVFASCLLAGAVMMTAPSVSAFPAATVVAGISKPLVVVRFNQRTVHYEQALYSAVSQAVNAKPDVMFDLISYVPSTNDAKRNETLRGQAAQHLRQVADSLVNMGVPAERLNISTELEPTIRFDEVHVFVR